MLRLDTNGSVVTKSGRYYTDWNKVNMYAAARCLGISVPKLLDLCHSQQIPHHKGYDNTTLYFGQYTLYRLYRWLKKRDQLRRRRNI